MAKKFSIFIFYILSIGIVSFAVNVSSFLIGALLLSSIENKLLNAEVQAQFLGTVYVVLQILLSFILFYLINFILKRIYTVSWKLFSVTLFIVSVGYYLLLSLVCVVDIFFGCQITDIFSFSNLLGYLYYKILPLTLSYILVFHKSNISFTKKVVIATFILLLVLSPIGFNFLLKVDPLNLDGDKNNYLLLGEDLSEVQMKNYQISDSGYSIKLPASYTTEFSFFKQDEDRLTLYYDNPKDVQFDYAYSGNFRETNDASSLFIDIYHLKAGYPSDSVLQFINYCGKDNLDTFDTRDFSEYCPSIKDIVVLRNGLTYCETLSKYGQKLISTSTTKSGREGSEKIENRQRVFIAQVPQEPEYCIKLEIYAEPEHTKVDNVTAVAEMILQSLKTPNR